jgi:hypothetical protein
MEGILGPFPSCVILRRPRMRPTKNLLFDPMAIAYCIWPFGHKEILRPALNASGVKGADLRMTMGDTPKQNPPSYLKIPDSLNYLSPL